MNTALIKIDTLISMADAIREKKGTTERIPVTSIANEIADVGVSINGIVKQYKVNAGETVNAGDFVEFVRKYDNNEFTNVIPSTLLVKRIDSNRVMVVYHVSSSQGYVCVLRFEGASIEIGKAVSLAIGSSSPSALEVVSTSRAVVSYSFGEYFKSIFFDDLAITQIGAAFNFSDDDANNWSACYELIRIDDNKFIAWKYYSWYGSGSELIQKFTVNDDGTISRNLSYKWGSSKRNVQSSCLINENTILCFDSSYNSSSKKYTLYARTFSINNDEVLTSYFTVATNRASGSMKFIKISDKQGILIANMSTVYIINFAEGLSVSNSISLSSINGSHSTIGLGLLSENKVLMISGASSKTYGVVLEVVDNNLIVGEQVVIDNLATSISFVIPFSESSALAMYKGSSSNGICKTLEINGNEVAVFDMNETNGTYIQPGVTRYGEVGIAKTAGNEGELVDVYVSRIRRKMLTSLTNCIASVSEQSYVLDGTSHNITMTPNEGYFLPDEIAVTGTEYTWDCDSGELNLLSVNNSVHIQCSAIQTLLNTPSVSVSNTLNRISWSSIPNATLYEIYVVENGVYKLIDTTSYTYYSVIDFPTQTVFAVRATSSNPKHISSEYSDEVTYVVKLATPSVTIEHRTMTWNAVENATSYEIFTRDPSTYSYTVSLGITTDTTFTIETVYDTAGTYYFRVVAMAENYANSSQSTAVTFVVNQLTAPVVTLADTTLTWGTIENAEGYEIWSGDVLVATTTDPTYDISAYADLASGSTFAVKAITSYDNYVNSDLSDTVTYVVKLAAPVVTILNNTISWEPVENATSYEVFTLIDSTYTSVGTTTELFYDVTQITDIATGTTFVVSASALNYSTSDYSNEVVYNIE